MYSIEVETPTGPVGVFERDDHIVRVSWWHSPSGQSTPLLREAARQLRAYFRSELRQFDLPLAPTGGEFQQQVCAAMQAIPFGETRTYGDIAAELGTMPQPVGQACGGNSIAIIIPCHRVLGASGLGGFSGGEGLETKIALLKHEGAFPYLI